MRRTRRHKIYLVSVFFLMYSIIRVYSDDNSSPGEEPSGAGSTSKPVTAAPEEEQQELSTSAAVMAAEGMTTSSPGSTFSTLEESITSPAAPTPHPTWRPRRTNCTPPAIEQFPRPLMSSYTRRHGGLVIHFMVAFYTFLGLAIVCDEYFVSSLDRICEELKLSPDVAGATFMAAGSSAPELATVVIGVFFAKDDIGVSGVIGSAVFNIMFVISVCALCSGSVCYLNWWPLVRDCAFYAISILLMLFTIYDEIITWKESLVMMSMYVVYCVALHFNPYLERWAQTLPVPCKKPPPDEQTGLVTYRTLPENQQPVTAQTTKALPNYTEGDPMQQNNTWDTTTTTTTNTNTNWDPNAVWDPNATWDPNTAWNGGEQYGTEPQQVQQQQQRYPEQVQPQVATPQQPATQVPVEPENPATRPTGYYKPMKDHEEKRSPLLRPEGGIFAQASWGFVYPIHYMCIKTIPNCKLDKYKNWYPFTFLISMLWISFYSYFMVWMITIIGSTLGIPDTVMGLTFVAAGVSVPDALSSIAVIREGYGDMAVSNAVGSNVFDILICLGLPWFIQTAIIKPGSHVNVISKGLTYSTLSLLSTVVFLVIATHLNGWKLDRRYGVILMIWYLIFIIFASMYELNMFGQLNPPECPTMY